MTLENLEKILNLIPKDQQIYLDLLKFGSSAVSTISVRTQIDRTTVYSALKRMKNRGLITVTKRNNIAFFNALEPDALKVKIEEDILQKQHNLAELNNLILTLSSVRSNQEVRPAVQIFEGADGVIALYELMLRTNRRQEAFLVIEKLPPKLKKYLCHTYIKNKRKRRVFSRVLLNDCANAAKYHELDKEANRESKIIPSGFIPFETEIIIGKNEIAVIDLRGIFFGVLIKSQSIRNTLSALFNLIWRIL